MKVGWQATRLGDVCEFRGGGTPSKAVDRYWQGNIPWVSPKDMKSQVVIDSIDHITPEAIRVSATSMIDQGSILMVVRSGILARTVPIAVAGRALAINQDLKALCPRPSIDSWFLYYALEAKMSVLLALVSRGATVHRLITDQIRAVEFMLPPRPEQQRIVAILDEAFEGIGTAKANAEKNLLNARALFVQELHTLFTKRGDNWSEWTLADVCDISAKLVDPREAEYLDLAHIGAGNIESKTGTVFDVKTARDEQLISGKFPFDESMVLYSKIRPYLMKVVRPDFNGVCSADIYPLAPKLGKISRDYLYHLLLTPAFTDYAITGSARAGMPKVNREHFVRLRVCTSNAERTTANCGAFGYAFCGDRALGRNLRTQTRRPRRTQKIPPSPSLHRRALTCCSGPDAGKSA